MIIQISIQELLLYFIKLYEIYEINRVTQNSEGS